MAFCHRSLFGCIKTVRLESAGVLKDAVMLGGYHEAAFDLVADNPGLTLFRCHQQLHKDVGFMTLLDYV
jgi:FtsP/CotA-like multicopper oxidase with cupredoxin domain